MIAPPLEGPAAVLAADAVIDELIAAARAGADPARLTKAPAGAGKTGGVVRLVGAIGGNGARIGVATQTNTQAFDLVDRLAIAHPGLTIGFHPASQIQLPPEILARPNVVIVDTTGARTTQIVVATTKKWAYSRPDLGAGSFDLGIVDEAYQMTSEGLLRIAELFESIDLVGDPGQLDPFAIIDDDRWVGLPSNPVLNAVDAVLAHHPDLPQRTLPVTRRLPITAAEIVNRAFYPDLAFGPATRPGDRRLEFSVRRGPGRLGRADTAWETAASSGWAYVELGEKASLRTDADIVTTLADLAERAIARRAIVFDERTGAAGRALEPDRIAVGVAHRDQRAAVTLALQQRGLGEVVVDTANRLQGREFDVTLIWHPLAGRTDTTAFHLDAGRMCVLTTRHRHACIVVGRAGTARLLDEHPPPGRIALGVDSDPEYDGWEAHVELLGHLAGVAVSQPQPD
jgi:AAA domain